MGRRNPAVVAGVAVAFGAPRVAQALPIAGVADGSVTSLTVAFGLGAAVGVAATGTVLGVASLVRGRRSDDGVPRIEHAAPRHLCGAEREARTVRASGRSRQLGTDDAQVVTGSHAATSYEEIAENYVGRATFRERMALRAQGVAATLRARLGASMMDGMPVIARADGSVGDVGTAWWTAAVGADSIIKDSGFADTAERLAIPSDFAMTDLQRLERAGAGRGRVISERVAFVDEGAYPERRTVDDLDNSDAWEAALRSLDEKIATVAPVQDPIGFIDSVGGEDTLDEPDNLEPETSFIPFKVPGGHPGVVDTESYVDYLIEDEFSKNSSTAARRSSRRFLRMLEGGTQPTSQHLADTVAAPSYVGKHFSMPRAAEA